MIILLNIRFLITSDLILIPHPLHVFSAPRNRCSGFLHSEGDLSKGMVPVLFYWCFPSEISGIYVWTCDMCMHTHTYIYIHIHIIIYIYTYTIGICVDVMKMAICGWSPHFLDQPTASCWRSVWILIGLAWLICLWMCFLVVFAACHCLRIGCRNSQHACQS